MWWTDGETDGQTDGQTDGIAIASTALAKRRAVKYDTACVSWLEFSIHFNFCCFIALAYTTLDKL